MSYYDPPIVDLAMQVMIGDDDVFISLNNLSLYNDKVFIGPSTRLDIRDYEVKDLIAYHIIEALKKQNALYYVDNVLASREDFELIMNETLKISKIEMDIDDAYKHIKLKLIDDFNKLIDIGKSEGIVWENIEKSWTGFSSSLQGEIYQISIPFQIIFNGAEYRFVLDYCTQLRNDLNVFLPGEFVWEGKM